MANPSATGMPVDHGGGAEQRPSLGLRERGAGRQPSGSRQGRIGRPHPSGVPAAGEAKDRGVETLPGGQQFDQGPWSGVAGPRAVGRGGEGAGCVSESLGRMRILGDGAGREARVARRPASVELVLLDIEHTFDPAEAL